MTVLTMIKPNYSRGNYQLLETIALTNTSTQTVSKGVYTPSWARNAIFVLDVTITGTTPLMDFIVKGVDVAQDAVPNTDDAFLLGGWDGITQLTTDGSSPVVTVTIGPGITADDTGSATVDSGYGVSTPLPPVMMYSYTVDGTTGDEDYNGSISVYWDSIRQ